MGVNSTVLICKMVSQARSRETPNVTARITVIFTANPLLVDKPRLMGLAFVNSLLLVN